MTRDLLDNILGALCLLALMWGLPWALPILAMLGGL
jgi:hypothetical protein